MALLLHHQGIWTISLVPRTPLHLLLHHPPPDYLALFSHQSHQRESGGREGRTSEIKLGSMGVQVFRIIRVKAKPAKLPICIKTKLWSHATSVHQSTMAAERIIVQELGQLNPTSTILLRKRVARTTQMGIMQTVFQEETGGRVHFITNYLLYALCELTTQLQGQTQIYMYDLYLEAIYVWKIK